MVDEWWGGTGTGDWSTHRLWLWDGGTNRVEAGQAS